MLDNVDSTKTTIAELLDSLAQEGDHTTVHVVGMGKNKYGLEGFALIAQGSEAKEVTAAMVQYLDNVAAPQDIEQAAE